MTPHKFVTTPSADDTCMCGGAEHDPIHIDYEARYLLLAQQSHMELLQNKCPCLQQVENALVPIPLDLTVPILDWDVANLCSSCRDVWGHLESWTALASSSHEKCDCRGRKWVAKPEAERLDALVKAALAVGYQRVIVGQDYCETGVREEGCWVNIDYSEAGDGEALEPWQAATLAILAALEVKE